MTKNNDGREHWRLRRISGWQISIKGRLWEIPTTAACDFKDHPYGKANNTTGDESNDGPGPFKKLYVKISKWTPPEGEFPAVDHYIGLCLWFVNSLDFNSSVARRYANSLSQSEIRLHENSDDVQTW